MNGGQTEEGRVTDDEDPGTPARLSRRRFLTAAGGAGAAAGAIAGGSAAFAFTDGPAWAAALSAPAKRAATPSPDASAEPTPISSGGGLSVAHCSVTAGLLAPLTPRLTDKVLYPTPAVPAQPGRLRRFELVAEDARYEVARDKFIDAWTFNGSIPGPTIRVTEGDAVEVRFTNRSSHYHTVHFHGIHAASADGLEPMVAPGGEFIYKFTAEPFGLFIYHCHVMPLDEHISRGLYGMLIIDPPRARPAAQELVMMMNGYDTAHKGDNDLYSVNGPAGYYVRYPIPISVGKPVRVYLANITEIDRINSFHLHANVFQQIPSVKALTPTNWDDTVMLCQGQRAILEFTYPEAGRYMFHAHQSEFAQKGWSGFFEAT